MTPDGLPADFRLNGEAFDPVRFFSGKFMAQGMFVDRFGSVQRRFAAEINCRTNDNQTELNEAFIYDDGETEQRVWTITKNADGTYIANTTRHARWHLDQLQSFALVGVAWLQTVVRSSFSSRLGM